MQWILNNVNIKQIIIETAIIKSLIIYLVIIFFHFNISIYLKDILRNWIYLLIFILRIFNIIKRKNFDFDKLKW